MGDREGDRETAETFYFGLLGLVPDPRLPGQYVLRKIRLFRTSSLRFYPDQHYLVSLLLIQSSSQSPEQVPQDGGGRHRYVSRRQCAADDTAEPEDLNLRLQTVITAAAARL